MIALAFSIAGEAVYPDEWVAIPVPAPVFDTEPLTRWPTCWFGSINADGMASDKARAKRRESLITVSDVRKIQH